MGVNQRETTDQILYPAQTPHPSETISMQCQTIFSGRNKIKIEMWPTKCMKIADCLTSRKHAYIILTPLAPLLYSKTRVYRGIHYFLLFQLKNIDSGYSLEPPCRGGSNEYPQSMF